jgi:hypothetical protein
MRYGTYKKEGKEKIMMLTQKGEGLLFIKARFLNLSGV